MSDPVNQIRSLIPKSKTAPTVTRRRTALAPLPAAHPFVSKAATNRAKAEEVVGKITHSKSLGAQIGGVFGGLIPGALHLVAQGTKTLIGPGRAAIDLFKGDLSPQEFRQLTNSNPFIKGTDEQEALKHKYSPLTGELAESLEQTGGRVAQLGPVEVNSIGGRKVNTYGDVIDRGEIVGTLLSDAMNLSIAGGTAGKALGAGSRLAEGLGAAETAARLGKAADVTNMAARMGGRVANAPIEAVGGVLKGGKSLWREAGQRAEAMLYDSLPADSALGRRLVRAATTEGELGKAAAVETRIKPGKLADWVRTNLGEDAGLVERTKLGGVRASKNAPSVLEQEVGLARAVGVSQADRMVADQLGPEATLAAHVGPKNMIKPGETLTPEGQALGHAYEAGMLDPEQMARIDKVESAYRKWAQHDTDRALAGRGQKPLDPRYTGDQPLDEAVSARLEEAGWDSADIDAAVDHVAKGGTWADLARTEPVLADILLDPQVYPAPWRETMHVFKRGSEEGAVGLPRTPDEILAAGIERPAYMSGKRTDPNAPRAAATVATSEGFGGIRAISAENHKATMGHGQYSLANAADALSRSASTTEYNHILTKYMTDNRLKNPTDILAQEVKLPDGTVEPPVDWATIHDEAQALVDAQNLGGMAPGEIVAEVMKERGRMVYAELNKRGYDVLQGNRFEPKVGDFDPAKIPGKDFGFEEITPDSIVLPAGLKARLIQHRTGADTNVALLANAKVNAMWKRNVLPLNAHWTIGDAVSNLIMAWRSGEISPVEMFRAGRRIKELDPAIFDEVFNRPELVKSGLKYQVAQELNPTLSARPAARTTIGRGIRAAQDAGFRLNEFANRVQRHEYVYAKLEKELQARGLSDSIEGIGAGSAKWKDPEVQRAIDDVVNDANNTLGSWDEMSPLEQRFATQVFPFWSWIRHINSLVVRTAVDNPTRVLWTLRVGALGMAVTPDDLPEWMRGSVDTPFGRVGLNWANPFYDVGSGALLSPSTALRSTSPLIKFGTTALTGRDLNRNLNMVSHRPGSDPNQIASAFYGITQASPFTRGALNLAPTAEVPVLGTGLGPHRRYGSGETILTPGTENPADNQSRIRKGLQMFNIPMPEPANVIPQPTTVKRRKTGLGRSGLGSGRLKNTGLSG